MHLAVSLEGSLSSRGTLPCGQAETPAGRGARTSSGTQPPAAAITTLSVILPVAILSPGATRHSRCDMERLTHWSRLTRCPAPGLEGETYEALTYIL